MIKLAVLADIHGNLPALRRVLADIDDWRPDEVIVGGDVINRGPRPLPCLELILERQETAGWQLVRGNHEDYVLAVAKPDTPRSGPKAEIMGNGFWTYDKINGNIAPLQKMAFAASIYSPDGSEVRVVHASMRHNRAGIYPETTDEELRQRIAPAPAVLCVGHTHRPFIRTIDQSLVVNVGSVGMPFDQDNRACYAQLTWESGRWQAKLVRLDYDREQVEQDFFQSGFIPQAGPLADVMLVEFRQSRPLIHRWIELYQQAVLDGELTLAESVAAYLDSVAQELPLDD